MGGVPILTQLLNNFFIAKSACFTCLINYLYDERPFWSVIEAGLYAQSRDTYRYTHWASKIEITVVKVFYFCSSMGSTLQNHLSQIVWTPCLQWKVKHSTTVTYFYEVSKAITSLYLLAMLLLINIVPLEFAFIAVEVCCLKFSTTPRSSSAEFPSLCMLHGAVHPWHRELYETNSFRVWERSLPFCGYFPHSDGLSEL